MEIYSDNYQAHLDMWLNLVLLCADTQREFLFVAAAAAAAESLRADSKFAHQPVSFQCEVKLSNISRSGPFEGGVTQQSSICYEANK